MKPEVRLIHHLPCSGGTIITRCLDALEQTAIISEVHPEMGMRRRVHPLKQLQAAYGLIDQSDLDHAFVEEIRLAAQRCVERGFFLIVRDHAAADFLAERFEHLRTHTVLADHFDLIPVFTVRHPIDTWLGMRAQGWIEMPIAQYAQRFLRFARLACETGYERYEDFVRRPEVVVEALCRRLRLPFEEDFMSRLESAGKHLTGASGRQLTTTIGPRQRRPMDPADIAAFESCPEYLEALDLLGYAHPGGEAAVTGTASAGMAQQGSRAPGSG